MEKFTKIFVKRPVTTTIIAVIIIILGMRSIPNLSVAMLPDVEFPTIMIVFPAYGMTSEEVEKRIVVPAERALETVGGIEKVEGKAFNSYGMLTLYFKWGTDMTGAQIDVSEKLNMASMYLPRNVKPMIMKFSPNLMPVMMISVSGNDWEKINDVVTDLESKIDRLPETSYVIDMGLKDREVQVLANYDKLIKRYIGMSMVQTAIWSENFLMSGGIKFGKKRYQTVNVERKMHSLRDIENVKLSPGMGFGDMALMFGGGVDISSMLSAFINAPQTLVKDVAVVRMGISEGHSGSRLNGKPSTTLIVQKRAGVNLIKACRAVRDVLNNYHAPKGIDIEVVMDQSEYITESISTLLRNLLIGAGVVLLVLMIFLRDFRVVLLVFSAIPLSLMVGLLLMYFSGITMNIMSLAGLTLAVGMLIDNAIVVTENIYRRNEMGENSFEASYKGSGEVGGAITASTLTTISVFLPIVFLHGFAERMFKDVALTVTYTLLASLFISLSFVPSMSRYLIRKAEPRLKWFREGYKRLLKKALNLKWIVVAVVMIAFVISGIFLYENGFTLMPSTSIYIFRVLFYLPTGTSPDVSSKVAKYIENYFEKNKSRFNIETIFSSYGMDEKGFMSFMSLDAAYENGFVGVMMNKKKDIPSIDKIKEILGKELFPKVKREFPGTQLEVITPMSFMSKTFGKPIEVEIKGDDDEILKNIAVEVENILKSLAFLKNIQSNSNKTLDSIKVVPDDNMLRKYHISPMQIAAELSAINNKKNAGKILIGGKLYDITVYPRGTQNLRINDVKLPVLVRKGLLGFSYELVPLTRVASVLNVKEPQVIVHRNGRRTFLVTAETNGISQSRALKIVREKLEKISTPEGYTISVRGEAETTDVEVRRIEVASIIGLILMYMIMAGEFESFIQPLIVMFTVPMSLIGIALVYAIIGKPLNVVSLIGAIMLFGIVVNNGIVMIDRINRSKREGLSTREAIIDGASTRLRPILMTSLTTIMALIPDVILKGEGKEYHVPMALTVIGGLSVATFLTLFFIPSLYYIVSRKD